MAGFRSWKMTTVARPQPTEDQPIFLSYSVRFDVIDTPGTGPRVRVLKDFLAGPLIARFLLPLPIPFELLASFDRGHDFGFSRLGRPFSEFSPILGNGSVKCGLGTP